MNVERITVRDAQIATVLYADMFDYPLTRDELTRWMLITTAAPKRLKGIAYRHGYFFPEGRYETVLLRNKRIHWQPKKWEIARRAARLLSVIPGIRLIGVTGGLAMNNAHKDDDIDLFFIVADGTLWASRLLATALTDAVRLRRHPFDRNVADKVCLNMFMTESGSGVGTDERDCFAAHEVLQMKPLCIRGGTYRNFLSANRWVGAYLPNAWKQRQFLQGTKDSIYVTLGTWCLKMIEYPCKMLQLWYMNKRRTHEIITDTTLRFHPKDARVWVKQKLRARLARFHIPLDKIFYAR